jgi:uncharacterized SAM-dependent methyltransferase
MHLQAIRDVVVRWPDGERAFRAGDTLHTENSFKYTEASFAALVQAAGFAPVRCWTDAQQRFGVLLAAADARAGRD